VSLKILLRQLAAPILRHLTFSLPVQTAIGRIWVPIIEGTGLGVYDQLRRGEETWKLKLFQSMPEQPDSLFLDVGVNLGQTLIELRIVDAERPYLGFEPNPDCLHYDYALIRSNGFCNVELIATGLGEETGILTLYLTPNRSTDSTATLLKDLRPGRQYDTRHVPIFNEKDLVTLIAGRSIGFVKVDVEGAELEVFKGIKNVLDRERVPVMCEVLFTDPKADLELSKARNNELMALLHSIGYQVLQIHKSADLSMITDLLPLEAFPSGYHTPESFSLCDYLFLPAEKATSLCERLNQA